MYTCAGGGPKGELVPQAFMKGMTNKTLTGWSRRYGARVGWSLQAWEESRPQAETRALVCVCSYEWV